MSDAERTRQDAQGAYRPEMRARVATLIFLPFLCGGCATIFQGTRQSVQFDSSPGTADVTYNGRFVGTTPATAEIRRGASAGVIVRKDGFNEERAPMQKQLDAGWVLLDVLVCPITFCIPVLVDAIAESWYSYEDSYEFKLHAAPVTATTPVAATTATPASVSPVTSACRLAVADAPAYAKRWADTHPDDKPRATGPSIDEFMATCRELPEEAQRCLVLDYAEKHNDACVISFDGLPPKYRTSVALLFSTP